MSLGIDGSELERYVDLLCEDLSRGRVEGVYTFYSIWKNLLATGAMCESHYKISPLTPECDACMRIFGTVRLDTPRDMALKDLEKAVTVIETFPQFTYVMPEVSVNVVRAIEGAKDEGDVAGIPGRIVKIRGKARAMMQPEFGVSRHMARILLTFLRYDRGVNACINIKYNAEIAEMLSDTGSRVVKTVGKQESKNLGGDVVVAALEKTLEDLDGGVRVLADDGGPGLEPMIYMFGEDAEQLAKKCVEVARNSLRTR